MAARALTTAETKDVVSGFLGTRTAIVQAESTYNANCSCPDNKYKGALCSDPDAGTRDASDAASDARDAANDG